MKKPHKIGAYIRVSTDKQVQVFEGSLDSQKYRMKEFVKLKNFAGDHWGEVVEFYIEEGFSAGSDKRPEYQRLLSDIRNKKIDLILVSDLTRLSRNIEDFCVLQRMLEKYDASFFSMKEQFETSTPAGRMMVNVMISLGQFEREQTAERVAVNCHSRALRGFLNGGPTILGYRRDDTRKGTLIVDKDEAEIVRIIFRTFITEGTRAKTIAKLHEMSIYPKRSTTSKHFASPSKWTSQSLGNVINQFAYIGYREVNKIYRSKDSTELKPWQQHKVVEASWPAIIDNETFYEAQNILETARTGERERLGKAERRSFFLAHLLTCGECGRALVGQSAHGGSGGIYRYYYHSRKFDDQDCVRPRLHADALEEKLLSHLRDGLKAAGYAKQLEKTLATTSDDSDANSKLELERVKLALRSVKDEMAGVWRLQASTKMSDDLLQSAAEQLEELSKKKTSLDEYLKELEATMKQRTTFRAQAEFAEENLSTLLRGWSKSSTAVRKRLLRRSIKNISITRSEMKVTFWLSSEERDGNSMKESGNSESIGAEVLEFRRRKKIGALVSPDQKALVISSLIGKIGSERRT